MRGKSTSTGHEPGRNKLLTVEEAADRLNVSVRNVRHHVFHRRIPIVKIGRLVRIEEAEVEALIERGRIPGE